METSLTLNNARVHKVLNFPFFCHMFVLKVRAL